jgi:hypothetical protein
MGDPTPNKRACPSTARLASSAAAATGVIKDVRLDFTPVLLFGVVAFVAAATIQLFGSLPGGERGLLQFEKACPIYDKAR